MISFNVYYYKGLLSCVFLAVFIQLSTAQVFPGDANNNGRINNIDLLYIGYAYGTIGPARQSLGSGPDLQVVSADWQFEFPSGQNFAHADADGNGLVDLVDFLTVFVNYNQELEDVEDENFFIGIPEIDPQLDLESNGFNDPLTVGSQLNIPIILGSPDQPIENLNGIAFTIKYPAEFVRLLDFQFTASWLDPDETNELFSFQTASGQTPVGELDVALTRFGPDPVTGWGEVGVLSIIIEDNLIGLLPVGSDSTNMIVSLTDVFAIDEQFEPLPVAEDSLSVKVYHPDALVTSTIDQIANSIEIFPNPVLDHINIQSPVSLNYIELYSLQGQQILHEDQNKTTAAVIPVKNLNSGLYLLKISTPEGQINRKISIQNSN